MKNLFFVFILLILTVHSKAQSEQIAFNESPEPIVAVQQQEVIKGIYPNPVKYSFILRVDRSLLLEDELAFKLYNEKEELILVRKLGQPFEIVERGHLPPGEYEFSVVDGKEEIQKGKITFAPF